MSSKRHPCGYLKRLKMSNLHLQLFGSFYLSGDDDLHPQILQARAESLLAYLILKRHSPQARQHLAFLLWPDSGEAQAYSNLRKALHQLRAVLPDPDRFLLIDTRIVQWRSDAPCEVDIVQFEQHVSEAEKLELDRDPLGIQAHLAAAAALYKGDLLPGCYEDWISPERERLREQYLAAIQRLIYQLEQAHDYAAAIHQANCLLRTDPLHEETYRCLMRLHGLNGDRTAALRAYHTCATTLLRELGVDPSPLTQEAYLQLLHLDLPSAVHSPPHAARRQDLMVGRKAEWTALMAAWQQCIDGHAHCVLIAGDAGSGKTRLAQEFARWLSHQGANIARSRAYAGEEGLAYAPLIDWLRSEPLQSVWSRLDAVWLSELARLVPDILPTHPTPGHLDAIGERWQRQRLFAALNRAILAVEPPLLLMLDDLQWCDQETLEWLYHLLHSAPATRLLFVATFRSDEVNSEHPLTSLLLHLRTTGQVTELELSPLSEAETAELAARVAEKPLADGVAAHLYRTTEGNPLFVIESVRAMLSEAGGASSAAILPVKVQAVIHRRLARLSPPARELANLAAVIGRSFTLPVLAHAYGSDEDTLVRGLDELWQRRIVREQGTEGYDFSHDLIREAVYGAVSLARRRMLHRRVAEAMEKASNSGRPSSALTAWHYEQAGLVEPAIVQYGRAATTAHQMYVFQDAINYLTKALELLQSLPSNSERTEQEMDLWLTLGAAWSVVKTCAAAETKNAYDRAFALSRHLETSPRLFAALWGLHEYHMYCSDYERALYTAEECLRIANHVKDEALLVEAHHAMWGALAFSNRYSAAIEHMVRAKLLYNVELHQHLALHYAGHDPGFCGLNIGSMCLWITGYASQARQWLDEANQLYHQLSIPSSLADAAANQAITYQLFGDTQATLSWAKTATQQSVEYGYRFGLAIGTALTGWAMTKQGEQTAGLALLQQANAQWQNEGIRHMQTYLFALWIEAQLAAGQIEEGIACANRARDFTVQFGEHFYEPEIYRLHGDLLCSQGMPDQAEMYYRKSLDLACQQHAKSLELRSACGIARLWLTQGRSREAYDFLAPIYGWFSEGFDTPDLQAALALLATLAN